MKIKFAHEKCLEASRNYKLAEKSLLSSLQEIDELKGYYEFGCKSLHEYATLELKLSSDIAYTFTRLARVSKRIPELKKKIESETIHVSQARMISSILTPENQSFWLEKAETLSKNKLEREIKREFLEKAVVAKIRYVAKERLELKTGVS